MYPFIAVMVTILFSLYLLSLVSGSLALIHGVLTAPEGYEDESGVHFVTR